MRYSEFNKQPFKYYFCYGSNLNLEQMKRRCPTAKKVGLYTLNGYSLVFKNYCDIIPDKSGKVICGIWQIQKKDEKSLDRYEGYPHYYEKFNFNIKLNEKPVEAMTYRMTDPFFLSYDIPTDQYLETVIQGHRDFKIPVSQVRQALELTIEKMKKIKKI